MKKVVLTIVAFLLVGFSNIIFAGQSNDTLSQKKNNHQDISFLLNPLITQYEIPGIIAAVISDNQVVAVGAAGVRKKHSANKITVNDKFHIGSDTKAMTATVIAILVEKGLLNWQTKVTDIFPQLKKTINPAYRSLTLRQLLTMRGGVPANINYDEIQLAANNNLIQARQIAMEKVLASSPEAHPGDFHYSNMSYVIAAHMAEKVTNQSWEVLMQQSLFDPLKMSSAGFGPPQGAQPVGHYENGEPIPSNVYGDNPAMIGPAGTVHLTIFDWAKFIELHLLGAEGKPHLLKLKSFQMLQDPISTPPPAYAMGWMVEDLAWAKGKTLIHAGSNGYWYAKVWVAPNKKAAILIAINQGGEKANAAANAAGLALLQNYFKLPDVKMINNPSR